MSNQPTGAAEEALPPSGHGVEGVVGIVLAGGSGRRIGGGKAAVALNRRPLIAYPLEAVWRALGNVAIVAKPDTELPNVPGAAVWIEPAEPRHPLTGIIYALSLADERPVLVCAGDMPFVTPELVASIARAEPGASCAVVAADPDGEIQPLLACFHPQALPRLIAAARDPAIPVRAAVAGLDPVRLPVNDAQLLFNVNTPDDLLQAAAMLSQPR